MKTSGAGIAPGEGGGGGCGVHSTFASSVNLVNDDVEFKREFIISEDFNDLVAAGLRSEI